MRSLRGLAWALAALAFGCSASSSSGTVDGGSDAASADVGSTADSGGGGLDSGSPIGADSGPEAAGDGGASASCTGLAYCDDFESYSGAITNGQMLGPWKATVNGTGIAMAVDTVNPYRGSQSLHITVPAGASVRGTLNQTAAMGLVSGNDVFGRAMVFYSSTGGNDLPIGVHSWLFNSAGTSAAADGGVTMNMGGGGSKMQLNYHPPPPLTEQSVQGGTITAGGWHCIQWQYDGSGSPAADQGKVWVDGTLAVDVPSSKGWNFATPWDSFDFGFTHYQTLTNPVDVYLDEFALDGSMVSCP